MPAVSNGMARNTSGNTSCRGDAVRQVYIDVLV